MVEYLHNIPSMVLQQFKNWMLPIAMITGGLFGVVISLCLFVWYLCTIDSFGRNYTAPWSGGRRKNLSRTFLRRPLPEEKMREPELNTPDRRRQA